MQATQAITSSSQMWATKIRAPLFASPTLDGQMALVALAKDKPSTLCHLIASILAKFSMAIQRPLSEKGVVLADLK